MNYRRATVGMLTALLLGVTAVHASAAVGGNPATNKPALTVSGPSPDPALGVSITPASARWTPQPVSDQAPGDSALAPLNGHVYFSSVGFKIETSADVLALVPEAELARVRSHIQETNEDIAADKLIMMSNGAAVPVADVVQPAKKYSGRHGYIESHWYGWKIHMDGYLANKVIGGTWVAAGAALAASEFGGAPAIFGIALGTAAGALQVCQSSGGSLNVYFLHAIVYNGFVCNPFA